MTDDITPAITVDAPELYTFAQAALTIARGYSRAAAIMVDAGMHGPAKDYTGEADEFNAQAKRHLDEIRAAMTPDEVFAELGRKI